MEKERGLDAKFITVEGSCHKKIIWREDERIFSLKSDKNLNLEVKMKKVDEVG